jgi:Mg2+-importing ATPase
LTPSEILLGAEIERMRDDELAEVSDRIGVFAKLTPAQKERIVSALRRDADAGSSTVARVVMGHARTADLVVALQTASDWKGSLDLDIADRLALESGRPVLIEAYETACNSRGRHGIGKNPARSTCTRAPPATGALPRLHIGHTRRRRR